MANKGNSRHIKRLASSRYMKIDRKTTEYIVKPQPGRHTGDTSIAIITVLKEKLMNITSREARFLLKKGDVMVNGRVVKEERYPVGFGDAIKLVPTQKTYRIVSGKAGSFISEESDDEKLTFKVVGKHVGKEGKIFARLSDGRVLGVDSKVKVNDSVILGKEGVEKVIALDTGKNCYVINGTHASETGKIKEIKEGTALRDATVRVEGKSGEFETLLRNIMVVGE